MMRAQNNTPNQKYFMKKKSKLQKKLDNPNSTLYRRKADKLWKELIFYKHNGECAICSSKDWVQAHHLIPREMYSHRHNSQNGILLCAAHHRFSFVLSPHKSPIAFAKWMTKNNNQLWCWLLEQEPTRQNMSTFKDIIQILETEYALERQKKSSPISEKIPQDTP